MHFAGRTLATEGAAIEFLCVKNDLHHVLVCGHSDCRAMKGMMRLFKEKPDEVELAKDDPFLHFQYYFGGPTMTKFAQYLTDPSKPIEFVSKVKRQSFKAYIDPEGRLDPQDRLSQINTLQQLENITTYETFQPKLQAAILHLHAIWYHVGTGEIYYFVKKEGRFQLVTDELVDRILEKYGLE